MGLGDMRIGLCYFKIDKKTRAVNDRLPKDFAR